ncbi:Retrovirus-related Pol polyprotein from transposon RE1 [Vitis vinifera]|uniref:Retrovirus-related Pol polyprotein from transposon RE1 n=1 Tax=Vitis vinifera TaxID=29760 RepID=A0A438GJF5_VITVI|nr:Retrovirus-related Pol polyprotein from transposon RE1 [Vitis vinifera]
MFDTKPAKTPGAVGKNLSKFDGDPMDEVTQYRSVVGALQYLTITRLDIAFAVNKACQFMQQPTSAHWLSVKRILRYLKGTMQDGLLLSPSTNLTIEGFSDADWGAQPDDRRSSSGYLVYLGGNLVSWSSTKQKVVSRSSAESEYRALALATAEIIWMQALLQELCVPIPAIPLLWYDNINAYHMAKNPVFHARTKHIEIDLHFIRDQVIRGKIQLHFVPTEDQPADILTKHLTSSRFLSLKSQLCIAPRPFHLRGDDKPKIEEVVTDPTQNASFSSPPPHPASLLTYLHVSPQLPTHPSLYHTSHTLFSKIKTISCHLFLSLCLSVYGLALPLLSPRGFYGELHLYSYADSGESSPRSRELEFENSGAASWEDQPLHQPSRSSSCAAMPARSQPRPHDNQLSYTGGETKILSVDRSIKFSPLINKLCALCEADVCFKYQLPGEDLDALISVTNDDDLEHMMHEYDRLCRPSAKPARLRLFLFPATPPSVGSGDMKTERERFFEAMNSGPIQSVDATSPPATAPPSNVDFLFGLDKGVSPPAPVAKLPVRCRSRLFRQRFRPWLIPAVTVGFSQPIWGLNQAEIQRQIQDLQRLQISAQEQGAYQRKSDDNMYGGETRPWRGLSGGVPATPGLQEQPVYMIPAPASVYHTPVARPVTGQSGQGYYAMRMGPDVYREQTPMYSVMQQPPVQATMPAPAPKLPNYSEGLGMGRPSGVGVADTGYTQVAYDSQGRQVYYTAPGGVVAPYQTMAAVSTTSGPLNQESGR